MQVPSQPLRVNVELKARLDDRDFARAVCARIGAVDQGVDEQIDTYFTLGRYRLKLRKSSRGEHWLIGYSRPDQAQARRTQYRMTPAPNPGSLKATLVRQWGVKTVVHKSRNRWIWQGRVRIHLDRVAGLGEFIEFEASVDVPPGEQGAQPGDGTAAQVAARLAAPQEYDEAAAMLDLLRLQHDFGITARDLVAESYSTMIMQSDSAPTGT